MIWLVTLCLILVSCRVMVQASDPMIQPFPLQDVRLDASSFAAKATALNREYMMSLEVDSLLLTFRQNARLPAPGEAFSGSWEDPSCEVRGQFMGHYLSASARLQGDDAMAKRTAFIVGELRKVQSKLGDGYLSAFPTEHFDRLESLQPVWAPYYVIHKIMAGLLDQYSFSGNKVALQMVTDMAAYFAKRVDNTIKFNGTEQWHNVLNNEFGGMSEVLHNLYGVTQDKEHLRLAGLFVKPMFWEPLVALQDPLAGLHANTHLAQVNGFAAQYEQTGDKDALTAVQHFFDVVTHHHSYATGGSNDHEFWGPADQVADAISQQQHALETEETCTQYNMLKVARYLFRWTGNVTYADYYERALINGLLGTQRMPASHQPEPQPKPRQASMQNLQPESHMDQRPQYPQHQQQEHLVQNLAQPEAAHQTRYLLQADSNGSAAAAADSSPVPALEANSGNWRQAAFAQFGSGNAVALQDHPENAPGPGVLLYLLPLGSGQGKGGSSHGWGTPLHSFWCCYGSSVESFSKLSDSIYFFRLHQDAKKASEPAAELYVNQMVSSSLYWHDQGLVVNQTATFDGPNSTALTKLAITASDAATDMIVIKLRIPSWVAEGTSEVRLNGQTWRECHHHASLDSSDAEDVHTAVSAGSYCSIKGVFKTGDVITAKLPMIIRAETIQDSRSEFHSLKALMIGPMLMAGLTESSRIITANASNLAPLVSELPTEGLVSLRLSGSADVYLQQQDGQIVAQPLQSQSNAAAMAATFRMLDVSQDSFQSVRQLAPGQHALLESMTHLGHFVVENTQGNWGLMKKPFDLAQPATLIHIVGGSITSQEQTVGIQAMQSDNTHAAVMPFAGASTVEWIVSAPKGRYPTGSKQIHGQDNTYVISPMGSIVDEKYTAYFEFRAPQ